MPIDIECPNCYRALTFDDALAGTPVRCPNPKCGAEIILADPAEADGAYGLGLEVICPHCQKEMAPDAVLCIECGYDMRTGKKQQRKIEEKDIRQTIDGIRFWFSRDRRGRWTLAVEGRVLGLKTGSREFDLRRYSGVVASYSHSGGEDDESEGRVAVLLEAPDGRRERVYRGENRDLADWLMGMFRNEVGLKGRTERA